MISSTFGELRAVRYIVVARRQPATTGGGRPAPRQAAVLPSSAFGLFRSNRCLPQNWLTTRYLNKVFERGYSVVVFRGPFLCRLSWGLAMRSQQLTHHEARGIPKIEPCHFGRISVPLNENDATRCCADGNFMSAGIFLEAKMLSQKQGDLCTP